MNKRPKKQITPAKAILAIGLILIGFVCGWIALNLAFVPSIYALPLICVAAACGWVVIRKI